MNYTSYCIKSQLLPPISKQRALSAISVTGVFGMQKSAPVNLGIGNITIGLCTLARPILFAG